MLDSITSYAVRSPVYEGLKRINDISQLGELPLTTYDYIQEHFDRLGVEKVLIERPARFWHTSGSTGKPKKVYYGKRDLDEIALGLFQLLYLCGARPWNNAWVFTASGGETLFGLVVERYGLEGTITPLSGEMDMIKALREASRLDRIDVLVGVTWLYLLIDRIVKDPKDFQKLVTEEVRRRVKIPGISGLVARYLLRGIDYGKLRQSLANSKLGFSHAEALSPYLHKINEVYPRLEMHDVFGATEQWVQAIQVTPERSWLSFFLRFSIPEIAPPEEVLKAKQDRNYRVKAVPWYEWEKGLRGELIITRPNDCLPLIRYPTGDLVEVMDPALKFEVELEGGKLEVTLPAIKALGRAADSVDFEGMDESGNFLGFKVYSRQVNDALMVLKNVRWWELYQVKGSPGRFVFLIIPESEVADEAAFRGEIMRSLVNMFDDFTAAVQGRAYLVGGTSTMMDQSKYLDIIITRPSAYDIIDREIKRRIREGRTMGQLKPKRIYVVDGEEPLLELTREKMQA
jgi:phenylacetate-coenzyme A ligase PaaK-like adenylate-forming protein